jgi:hypothetical protein
MDLFQKETKVKIRTGFVSNSSSSSFIVAFPHKPKDVEDVKKMLFGKNEWHYAGFLGDTEGEVPVFPITEKVFHRIKKEATREDSIDSIANGYFDGYMNILPGHADYYDDPEYKSLECDKKEETLKRMAIYEKYNKINRKRAEDIVDAFMEVNKNKFIVVMSFSDMDGESIEEHTGIFNRLQHIQTSYH